MILKKKIKKLAIIILCLIMLTSGRRVAVEAKETKMPLVYGSFIQGWLCRDWSQERWNQELSAMKELGMKSLIIQSSYDWATTAANSSAYGQDWQQYQTTSRYSLYPTTIEGLSGANNSADQLERALIAAKQNDMTIFIGLISDDRWWRFGWGTPTASYSNADLLTESYFATWCNYNSSLSAKMIKEIWQRYSADYSEQIGGWYYHNEIWNFDAACAGTDQGVYAQILANNFNGYLEAINENCPQKPLMLSPYFNRTLSTAQQYSDFWKNVLAKTNFRKGDIFAPQDCIGEHPDQIDTLEAWIGGLSDAVKTKEGMRFWVNNETFTSSYTSAPVDRVISQIESTKPYAQTHLLFSWNHYYNPLYNSSYQNYNDQIASYISSETEMERIEGGVEINGFQISTTLGGFRTVYSVEDMIDGQKVEECGLVFAMTDYADDAELYVGSVSPYVKSFAGTKEKGKCPTVCSDSQTATSFAMTMLFAVNTKNEFENNYSVRAYARLENGIYIYSAVEHYTVYNIAKQIYSECLMNYREAHEYLYNEILKVVNPNEKLIDYNPNRELAKM